MLVNSIDILNEFHVHFGDGSTEYGTVSLRYIVCNKYIHIYRMLKKYCFMGRDLLTVLSMQGVLCWTY